MTREQKITKLRNAIIAYRGTRKYVDGPWTTPARPSCRENIIKWMNELGLCPWHTDPIAEIDGFKLRSDMDAWIQGIRARLMMEVNAAEFK